MKLIKLITYTILLLSVISVSYAYDNYKNITIGTNSLPEIGQFNFSFKLAQNETLYFNLTKKSSQLNIDLPESYFLNNTNSYNLSIDWNITDTVFASNKTLNAEVLVTNSLNLNNYTIGMDFFIKKEDKGVFSINSSSSLEIVDGKYVRNLSILEFPDNGTFKFNIEGTPGEIFNVWGCDNQRFLKCKNTSFTISDEGVYVLNIPYEMPFTPLGTYNESFHLNSSSRNHTIDIIFNVVQPNIFAVPEDIEECQVDNPTIKQQYDCQEALDKHRLEVTIALNEYFSRINTENICQDFVKTEYVIGDSVDEEFLEENRELRNENKDLSNKNNDLQLKINSCQLEVDDLKTDLNNTITQKDLEIKETEVEGRETNVEVYKSGEQDKQEAISDLLFLMKIFTFIGFLINLGLAGFKYWYDNTFGGDIRINYYVVGIIGGLLLFSWFGLFVWG